MESLEQKYLAMLAEAQQRGLADVDGLRLCFEILALTSAIDRSCASRLAPLHLSEGKFVLLFLLHDRPDGLAPNELAQRAGVTRATITGLLDGLARDGYLVRQGDQTDRRKLSVRLTDKGQAMAGDLFAEHARWIGSLFQGFEQQERDTLGALLRRVGRNVAQADLDRPAEGTTP